MSDKPFIVATRSGAGTYTYCHSESSYSEAMESIPPYYIDDAQYIVICPKGFVPPKVEVEAIKPGDLPF